MSRIVKAAFGVVLIAVMAVTFAHADGQNPWHPFYDEAPVVHVVSLDAEKVGSMVDGQSTLEIGFPDVALYIGKVCPGVAAAYMMTTGALAELYPDSTPARGQVRVAGSTVSHSTRLRVASYITGAQPALGRSVDLVVDPSLAENTEEYVLIFQRKDTGAAVRATFVKSRLIPAEQEASFHALKEAVASGEATDRQKQEGWAAIQSHVRTMLLDAPAEVIEIELLDGYDFPEVEGEPHHDHHDHHDH